MNGISKSSEYAIRALTYIAQRSDQAEYQLARTMAIELEIPAPFLGKILQPLVTRGILISQRGRNGGFRLAHPHSEITLFQVVDAQEHLGRRRQCMLGQSECSDERACPLHSYWKDASESFLAKLANTTLADFVRFSKDHPESNYPGPSVGLV